MLSIGSLFSGVGGLELGLERAGLGPVRWQVEIDAFCRGVLAKHWPKADRLTDVRSVGAATLAHVDLICGGFPCQDLSCANTGGAGLAGERSGLWWEYERIIDELRPRWVVVENPHHRWAPLGARRAAVPRTPRVHSSSWSRAARRRRAAREAALGNSVVPPCAEAVGRLIVSLLGGASP